MTFNPRGDDGRIDYGSIATLTVIVSFVVGIAYNVTIRPLEKEIRDTKNVVDANATVTRRLEVEVATNRVITEKQSEALDKLAAAIEKLADELRRRGSK